MVTDASSPHLMQPGTVAVVVDMDFNDPVVEPAIELLSISMRKVVILQLNNNSYFHPSG